MRSIALPRIGTAAAWREAARGLLSAGVRPEDVLWTWDGAAGDLFAEPAAPPAPSPALTVPKAFLEMANRVVWHSDPERFARLYAFLWRVRDDPRLMSARGDAGLERLRTMEKNVNRCAHKMKAFVRFRDLGADGPRRRFAAWFEPTHHTVEPTAPFFTRRFGDMDWVIVTRDVTARFEEGTLSFSEGQSKPDLPEDGAEALWGTYFRNIFNPARVKIGAMTSEMPRKYWKNMPEAQHIPDLIRTAEARARQMQDNAPTLPPLRAAKVTERLRGPGTGSTKA
ncbi:TIGR03915 family putative DNA repair protein [Rhodobacteraceae bacterium ASV31]|nr:TIGR03915 family putative DNA repair protein [Anianabacter salinae]